MSALAEALLAAQRQALATLERQYVAGTMEVEPFCEWLDAMGCKDVLEQGELLAALNALKQFGAAPVANGKPDPASEPASQRQLDFLAKLANEKGVIAPDGPLTKARAHEAIDALKAGTYNADECARPSERSRPRYAELKGCEAARTRACHALCTRLKDAEYAYAVQKCGESVFERVYGITYGRGSA